MIESLFSIFSSRELATLFWVVVFTIWVIRKDNVLASVWSFIKSFSALWKFLLLLALYISTVLYVLSELSIWNTEMLKVTIYWIFGWSVVAFINSGKLLQKKGYLRSIFKDIFNITVLIAFFVNLYTFPLWFELLLVPFAVTLGTLTFFSSTKEEYKIVYKFLNYVQITFGTAVLVFCVSNALINIQTIANWSVVVELLLPVYMSILLLPFLYAMSWYSRYEQVIIRQRHARKSLPEQYKI